MPRNQGPPGMETFSNAVVVHMASKFSEELVKRLQDFHDFFTKGLERLDANTDKKDRKFKLRFHADLGHPNGQMKHMYWKPSQKSLRTVFEKLDWSITSFEMNWMNDEGEEFVLSSEDDVDDLLTESTNQTLVIDVKLKQPSLMETAKESATQFAMSLVQKAKHCICGGGQIEQSHLTMAEEALKDDTGAVAKMETYHNALSQEAFDIGQFSTHVPRIAAKLNMSDQEAGVLAMAEFVDQQASHEMKTCYDNQGNIVKHLTSWRTIRTCSMGSGKPDKIHFVYGNFALKAKVPEEGLATDMTMKLERYVQVRAKLEWRQQFEEDAQHVPLPLLQAPATPSPPIVDEPGVLDA